MDKPLAVPVVDTEVGVVLGMQPEVRLAEAQGSPAAHRLVDLGKLHIVAALAGHKVVLAAGSSPVLEVG